MILTNYSIYDVIKFSLQLSPVRLMAMGSISMPLRHLPVRMTVNPATKTAYVIFKNQLIVCVFQINELTGIPSMTHIRGLF